MKTPLFLLSLAFCAVCQTPPPDGLVSPEVHPDRSVTFRIRAPKATEVTYYGDWMPVGKPEPMTPRVAPTKTPGPVNSPLPKAPKLFPGGAVVPGNLPGIPAGKPKR